MKPRVVYTDWLFKFFVKGTNAVMLFPYVILRKNLRGAAEGEVIKNHELIHFEQAKELWGIGFYILYLFYFLKNLVRGYGAYYSYRRICFEMEAFAFQNKKDYLKSRKPYIWRRL